MTFSTTRRAGRMLRQQLISLCARMHEKTAGIKTCGFSAFSSKVQFAQPVHLVAYCF